jgi:diguanylate cyclase (GGDEF)-like protein/PAS domain S-box-containing protein
MQVSSSFASYLARPSAAQTTVALWQRAARSPSIARTMATVLLGLAIAFGAAEVMSHQREVALAEARRDLSNLATVLAGWVDDRVRAVELLGRGVVDWVRAEDIDTETDFTQRLAAMDVHVMLRERVAVLPQVRSLFLLDAQGLVVATAAKWPAPDVSSAGRDFFELLREDPTVEFVLSAPTRSRLDGVWTIYVSHRVTGRDGAFLGAVVAAMDLSSFNAMFRDVAEGSGTTIGLVRRRGPVLARYPHLDGLVGQTVTGAATDPIRRMLQDGTSGTIQAPGPLDGIERLHAVRVARDFPLVVVVTRPLSDALAAWHGEVIRFAVGVLLLEGALVLGLLHLERRERQRGALRQLEQENALMEAELGFAQERERVTRAVAERDAMLGVIFETGKAGVAELDLATRRYLRVNRGFCQITGRSEAELTGGLGPADIVHPDDRDAIVGYLRDAARGTENWDAEVRYMRPDGGIAWARVSVGTTARDAEGRPARCVAVVQDVTESHLATERLAANEALLRLSLQVGNIGAYSRDLVNGGAITCGREARELHGLPGGEGTVDLATWFATIVPEDRPRVQEEIAQALALRRPEIALTYRLRRSPEAEPRHMEVRARYRYDRQGRALSSVGVVIDVTEAREAEALLRLSLEIGRIGNFRQDFATGLLHAGPEARRLFGLPEGATPLSLSAWQQAIVPPDRGRVRDEVAAALADRAAEGANRFCIHHAATGELRHVEARTRYTYDADGQPLCAVGVVIDVTERHEAARRIAFLAHHDALTGLPNRALLRDRLDAATARLGRGEHFAVLCIDLDHFKEINDTLGHPAGDVLLQQVADRLRCELREADTLARIGGDEFIVLQAQVDGARDATRLAERLNRLFDTPFDLNGRQVVVGASIGIALAPADGSTADDLVRAADIAMYRAKADGRGRWQLFEREMDLCMQRRRALEHDLRHALAQDEFELFYQPIVAVRTRTVCGLEALIRWRHPERGLVPPDSFIPLAEETGLIVPIGEWVLKRACTDALGWSGTPRVAVNISAVQFARGDIVNTVSKVLADTGLDPARLELEITETVMLQNTDATLATLHQLKALGVRIAMDDFGTGYSSLSYLQRFPFDKVKIDKSFVRALGRSPESDAIVRSVAGLCAGLRMGTTAEGVETEQQFQAIARKGCREAQGFLFSTPRPAEEIQSLLLTMSFARPSPAPAEVGDWLRRACNCLEADR